MSQFTGTKNAIIISATLSVADHGCLSSFLHLDYGGERQGFGGYRLYSPKAKPETSGAGLWIWRILETVGVETWQDLPGKPVRVKGTNERVNAIGHFIKDTWFFPEEEFRRLSDAVREAS